MKQPNKILQSTSTLNIYWKLTDFCNFKCSYCPPVLHAGSYATGKIAGFPTNNDITEFISKLENNLLNGRHLNLQFGGGEPTLHPLFPEIVNRLKHKNNFIGVTTNGSRSKNWWEKILPLDNVTISLHPEFTNMEKINALGKFIVSTGTQLMFNLSCDPANWERTTELYNSLHDDLKKFVIPKVLIHFERITKENYDYTTEQHEWITQQITKFRPTLSQKFKNSVIYFEDGTNENINLGKITINNWNAYKGWQCKVNSQSLMIDFNGEIYAGVCQVQKLGHISNFRLVDDGGVICPFERCVTPNDLRSEKQKSDGAIFPKE